jgi:hypothetical protein
VLLANEPRAYREVLAAALQAARAHVAVAVVEPAGLAGALAGAPAGAPARPAGVAPQLVVCSRLPEPPPAGPLAWVVLYPDGGPQAVLRLGGQQTTVAGLDFDDLLALVDQTARLAQMS